MSYSGEIWPYVWTWTSMSADVDLIVLWYKKRSFPLASCIISPYLYFRLSYVNHAEDLASKLLQCFPKNRLPAQAALSHEYFSDLPPRLWELTDSEYNKTVKQNNSIVPFTQAKGSLLSDLYNTVCSWLSLYLIMVAAKRIVWNVTKKGAREIQFTYLVLFLLHNMQHFSISAVHKIISDIWFSNPVLNNNLKSGFWYSESQGMQSRQLVNL